MSKGKPKIFSLANLLALLGALGFGLASSVGKKVYDLSYNTPIGILVVITLLLSVFAIGAGAFKRAGSNFAVSLMLEIVFLLAFTGLTIIFTYVHYLPLSQYFAFSEQNTEKQRYSPFQQYFVVSERKKEILESIKQIDSLPGKDTHLNKLKKWGPFLPIEGTFGFIKNVKKERNKERNPIEDLEKYFKTPGKPPPVSVAAAILLYILMLTPYLTSKRSEKPTVLKKNEENVYKRARDTKIDLSAINS